jgi:hypothetical protein
LRDGEWKMRPETQSFTKETEQAVIVFYELGRQLSQSFEPVDENLPPDMALLLMQLALAELVRAAIKEDGNSDAG